MRAAELEYLRANNWVEHGPENWSHEALGRSHVAQGHAVNIQKQHDRMALGGPQRAKDVLPTGLLAVPAKWTFKPEEMSTEDLQGFVEGRYDSMNEGDDALVTKEREQAKEELRKRSIMALICWRGESALDWYGEDLIFHVLATLRRMGRDEVPPAHKEAYDLFRKLDEDERYTLAARALDEAP